MKKYKGIKITLLILIIVLLAMISFFGIYVQDKGQIKNIMPEYILGKDLSGYRRIELRVNDHIKETIKYDSENNVISSDDKETTVARTEEIMINPYEVLNEQNYNKVKEIIEKRFKTMQVKDYEIKQDKENGNILIHLPENDNTDRIVGQFSSQGKFEIVDSTTKEVLMTNDDIKNVQAGYGTISSGTTVVFININFNNEGKEKFKNITNTYVETVVEKEETDETNEETEEPKTETIKKQIEIKIDDETLLTTYFNQEISNGVLQLTVGSSSSNTSTDELQESYIQAQNMVSLLNSGKMPIAYEVEQNKYIYTDITLENLLFVVCILIIILTWGMIYIIIKYKTKGILASVLLVGYIAILLISLRIFNVEISINGIIGIAFSILVNYIMLISILKKKEILKVIKDYTLDLIPVMIIAIVFTFTSISIGAVVFWGIIIGILYNLSITNMLLKD